MKLPEEVLDKIFAEIKDEFKELSEKTEGEKPTLHNLEGATLTIGRKFERRVLEAALAEEKKVNGRVKKNAQNVRKKSKTED
jgi:hypothetical protein